MLYRPLADTGIQVSEIALGCWPIAGLTSPGTTEADSMATVRACFDLGINHLDTAYMYGRSGESERLIARALGPLQEQVPDEFRQDCQQVWAVVGLMHLSGKRSALSAHSGNGIEPLLPGGVVGLFAIRFILSTCPHPGQNARQLVGVEPNAVLLADVDNHSATVGVVVAVHSSAAHRTLPVQRAALFGRVGGSGRLLRCMQSPILDRDSLRCLLNQIFEDVDAQPEAGAASALHQGGVADLPVAQTGRLSAGRAKELRLLTDRRFRPQGEAAMMAEFRPIAHAGKTPRADGVEVLLMEREVGSAVAAGGAAFFPRRAARRTPHHRGVVAVRLVDRHDRPAVAAEPTADRTAANIELAFALRAGHQQSHGSVGEKGLR